MMKPTRWSLLRSIVFGTGIKDKEQFHKDSSIPFPGQDENTNKNDESCGKLRSKSSLVRKLSSSDGALNIMQRLITDIPNEVHKSQECVTQSIDRNPRNSDTPISNFDDTKRKRTDEITKVPVIMSRFLKTPSQKKHRKDSFIHRILSKDSIPDDDDSYLLRHAVRESNTKRVIELLTNQNTDINGAGQNGITALHEASIDGNLICTKVLISYGAEINCCDCEGFTPLDYAVFGGNFECASYLIEKGAQEDRIKDGQIMYKDDFLKYRPNRSATFS